jgi:hypothetical protein
MGCLAVTRCGVRCVDRRAWNDLRLQLGIGREHAMETNEMQPWTGRQRGEALQEFQELHDDLAGAISVRCLKPEHHLPGRVERQPLVGDGGLSDVPTEVFQFMTLVDREPYLGMQAKALLVDAALWGGRRLLARTVCQVSTF